MGKGMTGLVSMAIGVSLIDEIISPQVEKVRKKLKKRNKEAKKYWKKKSTSNIHSTKMTPEQIETMFMGSGTFK